jgi:hypothetical protein
MWKYEVDINKWRLRTELKSLLYYPVLQIININKFIYNFMCFFVRHIGITNIQNTLYKKRFRQWKSV